jgi:hypothetical protein
VALTSEATHLKDHNLKLSNNTKPSKNKSSREKPKQNGKRKNPARNLQMKKHGLERKSHPRKGNLNPIRCQILTRFIIGVKITRRG